MEWFGLSEIPLWGYLAVLCITLLYIYGSYPMKTWKELGVPGPSSIPFFGNAHQLYNPSIGVRKCVDNWQKQYGKIVGIQLFRTPLLVVTDPEAVKEILIKENNIYCDRPLPNTRSALPDLMAMSLVFQTFHDWKRLRRIVSPIFTAGKLRKVIHFINKTSSHLSEKMEEYASSGTEVDGVEIFSAFALDVITGTTFGIDVNSQDHTDGEFYKMSKKLFTPTRSLQLSLVVTGMFPFTGSVFRLMNITLFQEEAMQYFNVFIGKLISDRKDHREQLEQTDFLQLLLNAEEESTELIIGETKLTNKEVISQTITFLIGGVETTTTTLQYMTFFLVKHQDIQDKLFEEIKRVVGDSSEVTYEHCQQLKYMDAVISETLRMCPSIHSLRREASQATTLKGFHVPVGTQIQIPIYNIGRDPELFQDPDSFKPERFMGDNPADKSLFLPFGMGPRNCIGMRLALLEMKIALVWTLKKVRFHDVTPSELLHQDFTDILTPKTPLKFVFKSRA